MDTWPAGHHVMVTGHRSIRGERAILVRAVLRQLLSKLSERHPDGIVAVCGMAVGVDIEFAEAALDLSLPLVAAVPCEGQETPWPHEAKVRYWRVLASTPHVVSVWREPGYEATKVGAQMHARNRWMIDHTEGGVVLAVWDGRRSGGTWAAVREVTRRGRKVLVVDPRTGALHVWLPRNAIHAKVEATQDAIRTEMEKRLGSVIEPGSVLDTFIDAHADVLDSMRYAISAIHKRQGLDSEWPEE